jgi:hypothetical protein
MLQRNSLAAWQPDVTGHSVASKDQGADRPSFGEIEEGRITPFVRGEVVSREPDRVSAAVAVNGKIDEPLAGAAEDVLGDKTGGEHAVAPLTGNVVDAIFGEDNVSY